jgi:hypothetical protein
MAIELTRGCTGRFAGILAVSALALGLGAGVADAQQRSKFQVQQPSVSVQRSVIPQPRPSLQQRLQAERLSRNRGVDYDTVRSWQKRQDAQNQHQRNLDADRASDSLPLRDLEVPRMQRNCQNAITGNKYMPPPCR